MSKSKNAWADQLGPCLSEADAASWLGRSVLAVADDPGLLRLSAAGRPVYPVVQFHGAGPLPGLADVLAVLHGPLLPLTIASWLTSAKTALDGRTPVQALLEGHRSAVILVARQTASAAGR